MGYNKLKITLGNEFDERKIMYYLGIDLGGTNIAVGVVDENCKICLLYTSPLSQSLR